MATLFTSYTEEEFTGLLKKAVREIMLELLPQIPHKTEPMDIKEAAVFLKLEVNTLYEKTSKQLIPHYKKGNKLYFMYAELMEWIFEGKIKTQAEIELEADTFLVNNRGHKKAA